MEEEKEKRELRSPRDTEAVGEVGGRVEVVGQEGVAQRRAAEVGVVAPVAAAQQTVRTSRGSCGICHAS